MDKYNQINVIKIDFQIKFDKDYMLANHYDIYILIQMK